jgi:N-acetyl-anhydromuramyl-L-alanine amidase AmpD
LYTPGGAVDILETYLKDRVHPPGRGYGLLRAGPIQSIIVHATHGRLGSSLDAEARFLRDSREVSAHYLVGREGQLLRLLSDGWNAWHAGRVKHPWGNDLSLGIELHAAVSDPITAPQKQALALLLRHLMSKYQIPTALIQTHRFVALPAGCKSDPARWPQPDFERWRDTLTPHLEAR